ncbi:TPA: IS66 family insertion sequence element accessory protein TnpB, partial [Escherichia coli]
KRVFLVILFTSFSGSLVSRISGAVHLPVTTSSDTGVELLPVEITPDEQKEPVAAIAPSLSTSTQTRVSASSCK